MLVCVTLLAEVLMLVFEKRKSRAVYTVDEIRAVLLLKCSTMSQTDRYKEAAKKLTETLS